MHTTLSDCGLPYQGHPDDMESSTSGTPRPDRPVRGRGRRRSPLTAPHPAILNAIHNACGVRIFKCRRCPRSSNRNSMRSGLRPRRRAAKARRRREPATAEAEKTSPPLAAVSVLGAVRY